MWALFHDYCKGGMLFLTIKTIKIIKLKNEMK